MRQRLSACVLAMMIVLTPVFAGHVRAAGGTDPVYARLTPAQKRVYHELFIAESDGTGCWALGSYAYSAYRGWLAGTRTLAYAERNQADTQCTRESEAIIADAGDPLFKTRALYHDIVMDALLITSYGNTLAYDLGLALVYDHHNTQLSADIDITALKARFAAQDLVAQRQHYRMRYGY